MSAYTVSRPFMIGIAATVAASVLAGYVYHEEHRSPVLEVFVFALKNGRSLLVRTPDDTRILIDGGANGEVVRHLTEILPFYSKRIDMIIATNTDSKNISGLIDIAGRYHVGRAYIPGVTIESLGLSTMNNKTYATFIDILSSRHIETNTLTADSKVDLGNDVILRVFFPTDQTVFSYSKASAPEILFGISYKSSRLLFMGDASKKIQNTVASSSRDIIADSDVLIVSHAAASSNMSVQFMNIARPDNFVYEKTIPKSPPKSNAKSALNRRNVADPLAAVLDSHRFNTRELGTILITSDGQHLNVKKAP